jgi:hypothetical protein
MVLTALAATPFLANAAQGRSTHNASSDVREVRHAGEQPRDEPRSKHGDGECKEKHANKGNHYGWRNGQHDDCDTPPPLGGISGTVFYDLSYDGVRDTDEPGLANWSVMLSGPVNATTVTDAAGNYSFTGLPAGTYTVCEGQRFAWIQTAPQEPSACTSGFGYTIVIRGQGATDLNFGNVG